MSKLLKLGPVLIALGLGLYIAKTFFGFAQIEYWSLVPLIIGVILTGISMRKEGKL